MGGENLQAAFTPFVRVALWVIAAVVIIGLFYCLAWG